MVHKVHRALIRKRPKLTVVTSRMGIRVSAKE
jgi:hypothetical protein